MTVCVIAINKLKIVMVSYLYPPLTKAIEHLRSINCTILVNARMRQCTEI